MKIMIHATLGAKPKRRPNLVRWMVKHRISGNIISIAHGTMLAVEREAQNKEGEAVKRT